MKIGKNALRAVFCLALVLTVIFALASCDAVGDTIDKILGREEGHEHSYVATEIQGDCEKKGYTQYTCECGYTYKGEETDYAHAWYTKLGKTPTCTEKGHNEYSICLKCGYSTYQELAALGHDYEEKVTRFPTPLTVGVMSNMCSQCGLHEDTPIDAVTFTLPGIADALKSYIGNNKTVINARDTEIIHITETKTGDTSTYNKEYTAIKVAYLEINGQGENLYANIHFEIGTATYNTLEEGAMPTFESETDVSIIVNGEDVAVAVTKNGQESQESYKLSEIFYQTVASKIGISYELITDIMYVLTEENDSLALLGSLLGRVDTAALSNAITAFAETLIDKDGGTCTLDFNNVADILLPLKDKTVAALIDEAYGAGTMDKVENFLLSLPNMKVRDVISKVEKFAEETGADLDELYKLINYIVYTVSGNGFNVESEVISMYDNTVIEVIAELSGSDAGALAGDVTTIISEVVNAVKTNDVDGIYNLVAYGDANYTENDKKYSIIDTVCGVIGEFNNVIGITWTADDNGEIAYVDAYFAGILPVSVNYNYTLTDSGFTALLDVAYNNIIVSISVMENAENTLAANVNVYEDTEKNPKNAVFVGTLTYSDNGIEGKVIDFTGRYGDDVEFTCIMTAVETENGLDVTFNIDGVTVTVHDCEYVENSGSDSPAVPENGTL